jgi:hypothetical protein
MECLLIRCNRAFRTNVDRAYRIRLLEEENVELQTEVLTVRHEKAIVSEELRRERAKTERIKNNVSRRFILLRKTLLNLPTFRL